MAEASPAPAPPVTLEPEDHVPLEVDDTLADTDSAIGDGVSSYAASLSSSVNHYVTEYGRKFQVYRETNENVFPVDEKEEDRLDMHHALMLAVMDDKLHFAPIGTNPQRVIDLGTGTGIWAMEFADQYPSAEVVGVDLAPTQPNIVPPNLRFIIDDIEEDWEYEKNPFDFVHARYLTPSIKDWPRLVKQAYNCVKPGGWAEFQDWDTRITSIDNTITDESALKIYCNETIKRREGAGYDCSPGRSLEKRVKEAGFVNVKVMKLPLPLGTWAKDPKYKKVGAWNYYQLEAGLEGMAIGCLARTPGKEKEWSQEEIIVLCARARAEMKDPAVHGLFYFYVVYGQKPEEK